MSVRKGADVRGLELLEDFLARMAVEIAPGRRKIAAQEGETASEEIGGGRGAAAVVADFEEIGVEAAFGEHAIFRWAIPASPSSSRGGVFVAHCNTSESLLPGRGGRVVTRSGRGRGCGRRRS